MSQSIRPENGAKALCPQIRNGSLGRELRQRSLTPVRLAEVRGREGARLLTARRMSRRDVAEVTRMLSTLIEAALPVEEALQAAAAQTDSPEARKVLTLVRGRVMEGYRLSDALKDHGDVFPVLYRATVAAGETAGELGPVLDRLADYLEKSQAMRQKVIGALIYPMALAVVASAVIAGLMTFVVPKIVDQFTVIDQDLPLLTVAMIALSDFLRSWGLAALVGVIAVGAGVWQALRNARRRFLFDRALLRLPMIGRLLRDLDAARFARTLATLTASRVPLLESLTAAGATVQNHALKRALTEATTAVREGATLSTALQRTNAFPPLMTHMVASGEKSGALAPMLLKVADQMDNHFDATTTVAVKMLEPAIIVLMAGFVMLIVLAIMLPILRMNALVLS